MPRISFCILFSFSLIGLLAATLTLANAQDDPPHNVILIIADDLGVDNSGLYNTVDSTAPTPNIDAMAEHGVQFMNAWTYPICSSTRSTLITGRYGFRTGIGGLVSGGHPGILLDEFTLPKAMDAASGSTIAHANIGKWHIGSNVTGGADSPNVMGYDHFSGILRGGIQDYYSWDKLVNGVTTSTTTYATTELVNDAISWLDVQNDAEKQWFLWLAFNAPHTPFHLPPADLHSFDSLSGDESDINANPQDYYFAAIEAMDTEIGRLLDSLPADVRANTSVIYIGDNGSPGRVTNGDLQSSHAKGSLFNGGTHVPFVISSTKTINPNRQFEGVVNSVDLYPTILELMGIDINAILPEGLVIDGQSLVPALMDTRQATQRTSIYAETFDLGEAGNGEQSIRNVKYHFKLNNVTDEEAFFDLSADPFERTNLLDGTLNDEEEDNYCALYRDLTDLLSTGEGVPVPTLPNQCTLVPSATEMTEVFSAENSPSVNGLLLAALAVLAAMTGLWLRRS